jgi:beta-galactosidase
LLHEPRKGKFNFKGSADVKHFCSVAAEYGLNVLLQVGPSVGRSFDGGGLPYWLTLEDDVLLRSGTGLFMQHATKYLSRLISQILDLQITKGGPIVAMQIENAWECSNEEESTRYIGELSRFLRESGITIPFTNANDLWAPAHGSVHTWRSQGQQLSDLR